MCRAHLSAVNQSESAASLQNFICDCAPPSLEYHAKTNQAPGARKPLSPPPPPPPLPPSASRIWTRDRHTTPNSPHITRPMTQDAAGLFDSVLDAQGHMHGSFQHGSTSPSCGETNGCTGTPQKISEKCGDLVVALLVCTDMVLAFTVHVFDDGGFGRHHVVHKLRTTLRCSAWMFRMRSL